MIFAQFIVQALIFCSLVAAPIDDVGWTILLVEKNPDACGKSRVVMTMRDLFRKGSYPVLCVSDADARDIAAQFELDHYTGLEGKVILPSHGRNSHGLMRLIDRLLERRRNYLEPIFETKPLKKAAFM